MLLALRDRIPEKDNVWLGLARMYLKMDRREDAFMAIERAVEINPRNRGQLPEDEDFASIHDDPEFLRIIGSGE